MQKLITQAWAKQSAWLYLLLPFSALYWLVIIFRKWLYRVNLLKSFRASIPVMVIGNITVGGTGKTPLVIELVKYLKSQGVKVGVISRGYGAAIDNTSASRLVTRESTPSEVGDEPCEIVAATSVPMCVSSNRKAAIEMLLDVQPDIQLIISDDGLQHYAMKRDIEWVVLDSKRGFGNGFLLPAGFLREPKNTLKGRNVIHHGDKTQKNHMMLKTMSLELLYPDKTTDNSASTMNFGVGQKVHAIAGIGNPRRFYDSLRSLGLNPIEHFFSDHHSYVLDELDFGDDLPIVTTAKDAVKLRTLTTSSQIYRHTLWVLPVKATLSDACYATLKQQLDKLNIKCTP